MRSDDFSSRSSSPACPRQEDSLYQEETRRGINAKSTGRADSSAVRSSVLSSASHLDSTDAVNKTDDDFNSEDSLTKSQDAVTKTDDAVNTTDEDLSATNIRKRKTNTPTMDSPSPKKARADRTRSASPDETQASFRSITDVDIESDILKYPEHMREKLRYVYNYALTHNRKQAYSMIAHVAEYIHRHERQQFVQSAQDLCRLEDKMLPPTVLLANRLPAADVSALLAAFPRLNREGSYDSPKNNTRDESLDWSASCDRSPTRIPKKENLDTPQTHSSDQSATGLVSNLSEAALSPLRMRHSEILEDPRYRLFGESTLGNSTSASVSPNASFPSLNRSTSASDSNRHNSFWRMIDEEEKQRQPSDRTTRSPFSSRASRRSHWSSANRTSSRSRSPRASRSSSVLTSSPTRSYRSLSSATARSPSPMTAREPTPPPPPTPETQLRHLAQRIDAALEHLGRVGKTVEAPVLDQILKIKRGRSSCRTLLKKFHNGEDIRDKAAKLIRRLDGVVAAVRNY